MKIEVLYANQKGVSEASHMWTPAVGTPSVTQVNSSQTIQEPGLGKTLLDENQQISWTPGIGSPTVRTL